MLHHRFVSGPTLPLPIVSIESAGPARLRLVGPDGDAVVTLDASRDHVAIVGGPPRSSADGRERGRAGEGGSLAGGATLPSHTLPEPLRRVPVIALVHPGTGEAFVALDRGGRLWYGGPLGLWGAPATGYGGGLAVIAGLVVTATDVTPGGRDALVALEVTPSRRLVERARIPFRLAPIVSLATIDVNADGVPDLAVLERVGTNARLCFFVGTGDLP